MDESTSRRGTDTPVHCLEKTAGSTHSSTSGLSLLDVWLVFIIFIKLIYVNWPFWKRLANHGKTQDNVFSELMVAGGKEEGKG